MHCPKCHGIELLQAKSKSTSVMIDQCPECNGMWFDRGELERLLDVVVDGLETPRNAELSVRKCPRCTHRLRAISYRSTHIDVDACPKCTGIWLDGGELQRIRDRRNLIIKDTRVAQYVRRGRPTPPTAQQQTGESPPHAPRVPVGPARCAVASVMDVMGTVLHVTLRILICALRMRRF